MLPSDHKQSKQSIHRFSHHWVAAVLILIAIQPPQIASSDRPPHEVASAPRQETADVQALQPLSKAQPVQVPQEVVTTALAAPVQPVVVDQGTGSLASWLYRLRTCESSGNYAENTGNSFYGAYQFTISTWNHWNTGYARADLAPASVQDATIIENTNASSGGLASQNPGCYRSQGLSAFPPQS